MKQDELREIAATIRLIESRAKRCGQATLAYLLDTAALETEAQARAAADNDGVAQV